MINPWGPTISYAQTPISPSDTSSSPIESIPPTSDTISSTTEELTSHTHELEVDDSSSSQMNENPLTESSVEWDSNEASPPDYPTERLIDSDGFTLVGTALELKTALAQKQLTIRLTANIIMGTDSYLAYNGLVLDGNGYTMTYNKSGNAAQAFYINEANAVVWMKNIQFGTLDGNGATGWYGIITCYAGVPNIQLHLENISYYSANGQALYNPDGQIYFHGNNHFEQVGVGSYSQEWAETNHIEIVDGTTTVNHNTNQVSGFIYSTSTLATNTSKNSVNLIIRHHAAFNVVTNHTVFYNSYNFGQNILVEANGHLSIKQTEQADAVRQRFIYPDLNAEAVVNYLFEPDSDVNLALKIPIKFNGATGSIHANQNDFSMTVETGTLFQTTLSDAIKFRIDSPKSLFLSSSIAQTLGLNSATNSYPNVLLTGLSAAKPLDLYDPDGLLASIDKTVSANLKSGIYSYVASEDSSALSSNELAYLAKSTKWVIAPQIPPIIDVEIPLDIGFHTKNSDIGTANQGQLYNNQDYTLTNNGNTDISMSLYQFTLENEHAHHVSLLDSLSDQWNESMYLTLASKTHEVALTEEILDVPFGSLTMGETQPMTFSGKYNNGSSEVLYPKYSLTFRFEAIK